MKKNMLKKISITFVILVALIAMAWGSLTLYKNLKQSYLHPYHAIPENAILIVKTSNIEQLWNEILPENDLFSDLILFDNINEKSEIVVKTNQLLKQNEDVLELIKNNDFYISIHASSDSLIQTLYILPYTKLQEKRLSKFLNQHKDNDFEEKDKNGTIYKFSSDKPAFYYLKQGILAISYDKNVLINSLESLNSGRRIDDNADFKLVDKTAGKKVDISLFLNYKSAIKNIIPSFTEEAKNIPEFVKSFSNWLETDVHIRKKMILWNGYSSLLEDESYLNVYKNQNIGNNNFLQIVPRELLFLTSISFSESSTFLKQIQNFKKTPKTDESKTDNFWSELSISQITAVVYQNNNQPTPFIITKPIDITTSKNVINQNLESATDTSSYLGFWVGKMNLSNSATAFFPAIFSKIEVNSFAQIDSFLVFANDISEIKHIIECRVNAQTFAETNLSAEIAEYASDESNIFIFCAVNDCKNEIVSLLNENLKNHTVLLTILENTNYFGLQYSAAKDNLMMTSAFIKYESKGKVNQMNATTNVESLSATDSLIFVKKTPKKILEITAPSEIANAQILTDPSEDYFKIAIVDTKFNMMLYDNKGNKLWQIKLKDAPNSKITMVDFYKNGKWQMYFNSPQNIYLIDKLGRPVGKTYPYSFRVAASNQGTIIDINNKKDYRAFFINTNRQISSVDLNTNLVSTWKMPVLNRPSNRPIQANKANGKWILTATDNEENLHFFNIDGIPAFNLQKNIPKHPGSQLCFIDEMQPAWYYLSNSGFIVKILSDGKISEHKIPIKDIPYAFTAIRCLDTKTHKFVIVGKEKIHIISYDLTKSTSFEFENSGTDVKIKTLSPSLFSIQNNNKNYVFDYGKKKSYEINGNIDLLTINNVKYLTNHTGSTLHLMELE